MLGRPERKSGLSTLFHSPDDQGTVFQVACVMQTISGMLMIVFHNAAQKSSRESCVGCTEYAVVRPPIFRNHPKSQRANFKVWDICEKPECIVP